MTLDLMMCMVIESQYPQYQQSFVIYNVKVIPAMLVQKYTANACWSSMRRPDQKQPLTSFQSLPLMLILRQNIFNWLEHESTDSVWVQRHA